MGIIGKHPSVSKINQLHVGIFWFVFYEINEYFVNPLNGSVMFLRS